MRNAGVQELLINKVHGSFICPTSVVGPTPEMIHFIALINYSSHDASDRLLCIC
jgi:hypothetical protein